VDGAKRTGDDDDDETLDAGRGLRGHRHAHAGHRGGQHRALSNRRGPGGGLGGLQWTVDAYTLAIATTVLTAGSLADRLGRRRVFSVGLVLFTAARSPSARWSAAR
jgi:MFS family permease